MFFMSREARGIFESITLSSDNELSERLACEQAVMKYSVTRIEAHLKTESIYEVCERKATLADFNGIMLIKHLAGYRYITEEYVTRDYTRVDLLKLAYMIFTYDTAILKKCGDRCKHLGHFTIPYLSATLENEGATLIEEYRKDARIEQAIRETPKLSLPNVRPTNLTERLEEMSQERRIDDALKGKE